MAVFPLRFGASVVLLEHASPSNMIEIIQKYKATICFTAPTAYSVMLTALDEGADLSSLRAAVSAGETLSAPIYDWMVKTSKPMIDGIGTANPEMGELVQAHIVLRDLCTKAISPPCCVKIVLNRSFISINSLIPCVFAWPKSEIIFRAKVSLNDDVKSDDQTIKQLQHRGKSIIAPYKYPRSIVFVDSLPKTQTGKIQRFRLGQTWRLSKQCF